MFNKLYNGDNMTETYIVRLTTGEELLCSFDNVDQQHYHLKSPYLILPTAEGSIQFMKYMAYATFDELPVKVDHIMWIVKASAELGNKYQEMTGAIAVPQKEIIT